MQSALSVQMGQFTFVEKRYRKAVFGESFTSVVTHNITLFVGFEATIAPESNCGLFIDQRSKVLPVVVIPCVCFGTPQSV